MKHHLKKFLLMTPIWGCSLILCLASVQPVYAKKSHQKKLKLWPYIHSASIEAEKKRTIEGISFIVGGGVSIILPFLTTQSGSALRDIGFYTLLPLGILSVSYGGYTLLTDSSWLNIKESVIALSGPKKKTRQWRMRREAHAREALLNRADNVRFWRYIWGGFEAGLGTVVIIAGQGTFNIITSGVLFGLSAYHFTYKKKEERMVKILESIAIGIGPKNTHMIALRLTF